jgi:MoxR-like ATPase
MNYTDKLSRVSESPTIPAGAGRKKEFDVADLFGEAGKQPDADPDASAPLDDKFRKAYFWIANNAIISPFYDIEFSEEPPREFEAGDFKSKLTLPTGQSYSSFILMPLLNLAVRKRCLFVGGPGRGKTASAILMGLLAGYNKKEIRQAVQHGQPQMTVSDLLGNPLPSDLMNAKDMGDIKIAWRKWLGMRVKIIDEYNRIPTRTQSALLTVMGDNYAELMDQIFECPEAAWYLTANDDAGGGTYQVIEALRDRIDIVVRALHFNSRFLPELLARIEGGVDPSDAVPAEIIFSEDEITKANNAIRAVAIPDALMRRFEFFASQFEMLESGAVQFEYKTKDNVKVSGLDMNILLNSETGRDKIKDIGTQTMNGISVRAFMTCLVFIKALAWFRGKTGASFEDARAVLPFVLHDKLVQNGESPVFSEGTGPLLRADRISWLRGLFDMSCAEYDRLGLDKKDPVRDLMDGFSAGLASVNEDEAMRRMAKIETSIAEIISGRKLYGPVYDDLLTLKYLHQRYGNYLKWLRWKG